MAARPPAKSYDDLDVYNLALNLQRQVFTISKRWPREERYSLTDQMRRSARAVGANIAEAWAKRRYEAHFISKLTDADAELCETQHWAKTACECGYLEELELVSLQKLSEEIGRKLGKMMAQSALWVQRPQDVAGDR